MQSIVLDVKGMSCGHCVRAIEGAVGGLNGVEKVAVALEEGKVEVEFSPDKVTIEQIKEAIDEEGYEVE
ncbi:MAG TPA: copper chaperone CopZ [Bacillus sp. (in: firmicutes)]|uniref:copper chaperone CopZ n=1 Tax=Bacillus litorisediminis TaxID=2922713 RepID=UPI001FAC8A2F|nr:copper chaperone CopZ [Bacillus litorisediminis]HWO76761.1 copper chaperone CopZ [Bacillus sp. (in: firmicutes)]